MEPPEPKGRARDAQRPAQRLAQRGRILDAARRIAIRDGMAALSMRKIAGAIGYSPASLYLYFQNRDEIARALGDEAHAQLLAELEPIARIADAGERLRSLALAYVAFGRAHPEAYRMIFVDWPGTTAPEAQGATQGEGGEPVACVLADALAALGHAHSLPLAEALWATLHGIVTLSLVRPGFPHTPPERLVATALDAWLGVRDAAPAGAVKRAAKKTKAPAT